MLSYVTWLRVTRQAHTNIPHLFEACQKSHKHRPFASSASSIWSSKHSPFRPPSAQESDSDRSLREHVLQRLALPACLGQLGSRDPVFRAPPHKTLIDWSLIFLTGWHPATKPWNSRDPWEGIEGART